MKTKSCAISLVSHALLALRRSGGTGQLALRLGSRLIAMIALAFACSQAALASAPAQMWGIIDKVVTEGSDQAPEKVQIWGTFSTVQADGKTWSTPVSGYLFYTIPPEEAELAAKAVKDLKARAGADDAVAFGFKRGEKASIREWKAEAKAPDTYPIRFVYRLSQPKGLEVIETLFDAAKKHRAAQAKI